MNARDRVGFSALNLAAWAGDVEIMRLLLAKGADVNARDSRNLSPLFFALANVALVVRKGQRSRQSK
ncbi:MAG: ankyrin repeat domain-containing protein [Bryobacteraceae bacterium]